MITSESTSCPGGIVLGGLTTSSPVDFAALYNDVFAGLQTSVQRAARKSSKQELSSEEIEEQCRQIDELWVELGNCIHKWKGYPAEFVASRFANMHYVKQSATTSSGYAYPDDAVWNYLVNKVLAQQRSQVVIIRHASHEPNRILSWR